MQNVVDKHKSTHNYIYALHGFLGQGSDWSATFNNWNENDTVITPDYLSNESHFSKLDIDSFINDINKNQNKIQTSENYKKVFIGYSLGGRMGLQILERSPELFDQYIFISTHSGLNNELDKKNRIESDKKWIDQIQDNSWDVFLQNWNIQEVLNNSIPIAKVETFFNKIKLIECLSKYSLGNQKDYSDLILKYQNKITWIIGDQDNKFLNLAEDLKQKKILLDYKRIFSGHRILLDNPIELQEIIKKIIY